MSTRAAAALLSLFAACAYDALGPGPREGTDEAADAGPLDRDAGVDDGVGDGGVGDGGVGDGGANDGGANDGGAGGCGDGTTGAGETCDGDCPTSCPAQAGCARWTLRGSATECSAWCEQIAVTTCANADGCCPGACTIATDSDCDCPAVTCAEDACGRVSNACGEERDCGGCGGGERCVQNRCETLVGAACASDADCERLSCVSEAQSGFPAGYCTTDCERTADCPDGTVCDLLEGVCLRRCSTAAECRASGYACTAVGAGSSACLPFGAGTAGTGAACTSTASCAGGERARCLTEEDGFRGGYCSRLACTSDAACGAGGRCARLHGGLQACVRSCTDGASCRSAGYSCADHTDDGASECWPSGTGAGGLGTACEGVWDCQGGASARCLRDWPQGSCSRDCASDAACGTGGVCHKEFGEDAGFCVPSCSRGSNACRAGYACKWSNSAASGVCVPLDYGNNAL